MLLSIQSATLTAGNTIATFYNRINEASFYKDFPRALSVLSELDSFHKIVLGNDVQAQIQLTALPEIQRQFFDEKGNLKPYEVISKVLAFSC